MRGKSLKWLVWLLVSAAAFWAFLEFVSPYWFLEDDNRDYWLPLFVHYARTLAHEGTPAFFNFHQFLGEPCLGASQVFYPFVYASVFLSEIFSGGFFWSVEIFALLHLLLGAAGMFLFIRELVLGEKTAFWGAFTWFLCPFTVFAGASWWFVFPVFAFIGWIHFFTLRLLRQKPGAMGWLVVCRLLFFYSGYGQYFVYALLMEIIFAALCSPKKDWAFARGYAESLVWTLVFSLPLLLPTLAQMSGSQFRAAPLKYSEFASNTLRPDLWLWGLFYPFSDMAKIRNSCGLTAHLFFEHSDFAGWFLPYISHIGYITLAALAVAAVRLKRGLEPEKTAAALAVCAAVSLLWASGAQNGLVYFVPVLNRFRWHFKLGVILNFYLVALAAFGFARFSGKRKIYAVLIFLTTANFGALYLAGHRKAFAEHAVKNPITEPLREKLSGGRIFSLGYISGLDFDPRSLGFNYATLWGLYHFAGYDSFVPKLNSDAVFGLNYVAAYNGELLPGAVDYFRKWGVKWYAAKESSAGRYGAVLKKFGVFPAFEDESRVIFQDPAALPFAFWQDSGEPVKIKILANRLELETSRPSGGTVIANFLNQPFFSAGIDGIKTELGENDFRQLAVKVPGGNHRVVISYSNGYFKAGLILSLLAALATALSMRRR